MKVNERKQQQIKIAHILKDLGLEDDLIEKMTSLKKEEYQKNKKDSYEEPWDEDRWSGGNPIC